MRVSSPTALVVVAGLLVLTPRPADSQTCTPTDADCDGISDEVEHQLLVTFRPELRFSRDNGDNETFRPVDVATYLRTAEIDGTGKEGEMVLLPQNRLARDLGQLVTLKRNGTSSSLLSSPRRTDFYINPNDAGRRGVEWSVARASRRTGLYGHVVPIHLDAAATYDRTQPPAGPGSDRTVFYKIEYWQLFGYSSNNKPLDIGDHEGDWVTVQLIVRPARPAIGAPAQVMSVFFYAHGKEMAFDLASKTEEVLMENNGVKEVRGSQYNQPVPALDADGAEAKARNHVLRLRADPTTGAFTHPVVFVEHGGHEFWPSPFWEIPYAQKHGGDDAENSYLTETPPNLGEVEHPLAEEPLAAVILQYNGYWGTYSRTLPGHTNNPPPGPALHFEWTWPASSSIRWQLQGIDY